MSAYCPKAPTAQVIFGDDDPNDIGPILSVPEDDLYALSSDYADQIFGEGGADKICALGGNDQVWGGGGSDLIDGGSGNDFILGDANFFASPENALGGNDYIRGGSGDDTVKGQDFQDTIFGEDGNDKLYGGTTTDVNKTSENYGVQGARDLDADTVCGGRGHDFIYGDGGSDLLVGDETYKTTDRNGNPTFGDDSVGAGNDTIYGGTGNDSIDGGYGNDSLHGQDGNDKIQGDAGNDTITGGNGNDLINGSAGADSVDGGAGVDSISGGAGNDTLDGGNSGDPDIIIGEGGNDKIYGRDGDDQLAGGTGNDTIDGGNGNDSIWGEEGNDSLIGGAGNDKFYFDQFETGDPSPTVSYFDTINGWNDGDKIVLCGEIPQKFYVTNIALGNYDQDGIADDVQIVLSNQQNITVLNASQYFQAASGSPAGGAETVGLNANNFERAVDVDGDGRGDCPEPTVATVQFGCPEPIDFCACTDDLMV